MHALTTTSLSLPFCLFLLTPLTHFHLNDTCSPSPLLSPFSPYTLAVPRDPPASIPHLFVRLLTQTLLYCFCHLKSPLSPKLCLLLLYFGTQWAEAKVHLIWMRHLNFCLPKWWTDWLSVCVCLCPPIGCLVSLSYCLYPFIAIRFIYQSVWAYLNLWQN